MTSTDKAKAWGDVFWRHVRQGCDRSDAAFRADHAELADGPNGINSMTSTTRRIWAALEKHNTGKVEISEIVAELVRERDEARAQMAYLGRLAEEHRNELERDLDATRKLLAEAEAEAERLAKINSGLCHDFNTLLVEESRTSDKLAVTRKLLAEAGEQLAQFLWDYGDSEDSDGRLTIERTNSILARIKEASNDR